MLNENQEIMYDLLKQFIKFDGTYFNEDLIFEMAQERNINISYEEASELANKINSEIDFITDENLKYEKLKKQS